MPGGMRLGGNPFTDPGARRCLSVKRAAQAASFDPFAFSEMKIQTNRVSVDGDFFRRCLCQRDLAFMTPVDQGAA